MEQISNYNSVKRSRRKIISGLGIVVFVAALVLACFNNKLQLGRIVVGTFGYMTYPLCVIGILVSLAGFLGFSYMRSKKSTALFIIFLTSVVLVVHAIGTFKALNTVANFQLLKDYLTISYSAQITFAGSVGSVLCGFVAILLGAMGVIVLYVILATLFIGLFLDYQNYGKYSENIKKLKTKQLRKKVYNSYKGQQDGEPKYSFTNQDELDSVSVDASKYEEQVGEDNLPNYNEDDKFAETTYDNYENITNKDNYTDSQASDRISDLNYSNAERSEFMSSTFGTYNINADSNYDNDETNEIYNSSMSDFNADDNVIKETESGSDFDSYNFGDGEKYGNESDMQKERNFERAFSNDDDSSFNIPDDVASMLNQSEDDDTYAPKDNDFSSISSIKEDINERNSGFGSMLNGRSQTPVSFAQNENGKQNVVVPQRASSQRSSGVQGAMGGIRYNPPTLDLLNAPVPDTGDYSAEQARKSSQLEQVLFAFGINAKVARIVRGPKVTRYELSIPLGIPVKRIPNYEADIQRALAAKAITIRAPIPGSQYVGIELENDTQTMVYERELLESPEYQKCKDPLPVAIGKDISGEIVVKSLPKLVHLLVCGQTNSGKSVFMHNVILSLIFKYGPEDLKFIIIDPKQVEFGRYNGIPHLLTPTVIMSHEQSINALKWCVKEMERRYKMLSKAGYNNIEPYNKSELVKSGEFEKFPYIVIIVDELAELMNFNKKDVDLYIQRLTQLARACGIHLVIATQRPSVDVISGVIKSNMPSRIAFSVKSQIDSRTILDTPGAENLLGRGDMLLAATGTNAMPRLQASYATDEEIESVIKYIKENNPSYFDERILNAIENPDYGNDDIMAGVGESSDSPRAKGNVDSYFKEAVSLAMMNDYTVSISYLQRKLSIGFARAARIVDQMEERGYVASAPGQKTKKVIITPEQFKEDFGVDYNEVN